MRPRELLQPGRVILTPAMNWRLLLLLSAGGIASACHDTTANTVDAPRLLSVSGSTFPVLRPGDTVVVEGSGFGNTQGSGSVMLGGSPATVTSWSDNQVLAVVPEGVASGSIAVVPDTGATVGPLPMLVRPATTGFSTTAFAWNPGPELPVGARGLQLAALTYPADSGITARLHASGGTNDTAVQLTSLFATADDAGPATWSQAVDPLPAAYLYSGSATATQANARLRRHSNRDSTVEGVSYLLGGMDGAGRVVSDVNGMSVWENGDEGAWTRLVALPDPRAAAAAVVAYGNLYLIGGFGPDSLALTTTSVAVVDSFGAPAGWLSGPPLPEGRAFSAVLVHDHTMYVIGGEAGHIDPSLPDSSTLRPDVFAIRLSPRTGFFVDAGWTTLASPLSGPRSRHAAFDVDAGVLVSTGVTLAGAPESEYAPYLPDGTLGTFVPLTGATIGGTVGGSIAEAGYATYLDRNGVPHVVLVGGVTASGGLSRQVWWH